MEVVDASQFDLGVAGLAMEGYAESGDRHIVQHFPDRLLIAAIDGVGHGPEAAAAANAACRVAESNARENVISVVRRCHERLKGTRGVAMSLAEFDLTDGLLTWLGVGNVRGILLSADGVRGREEHLLQRPGIVGGSLPPLQATVLPIAPGDMLIFATDGIRENFEHGAIRHQNPQRAADQIIARHAKRNDDALILIARYRTPNS